MSNDSENESTDNIGLPTYTSSPNQINQTFGSGAYEFVRRMLHRYVNTSLSYLIVLVFLVGTIMDVVEMMLA
jgi:hypothetical protein